MRNPILYRASILPLLIAACFALMAPAAQGQEVVERSYDLNEQHIFVTPRHRDAEATNELLITPSRRVDSEMQTPSWKTPPQVHDVAKDLEKARLTWWRARRDPALRREARGVASFMAGEYNNGPHLMGRNAMPLTDVEQSVLDQPERINEVERPMLDMLGETFTRGVFNVALGWLEIPRHTAMRMREYDPVSGAFVGMAQGTVWTLGRMFTGLGEMGRGTVDLLRFPFKRPEPLDHRARIMPEWVLMAHWGDRTPIIDDPHNNWDIDPTK